MFRIIALTFFTCTFKLASNTPIHGPPPEFFTCEHRDNGLYADTKRECRFYWECGDIHGTPVHHRCQVSEELLVFDDLTKTCVPASRFNGKCPRDYGHFTSAEAFCQGRPSPDNENHSAFYPDKTSGCTFYYQCTRNGNTFSGVEFKCENGNFFDESSNSCNKISSC